MTTVASALNRPLPWQPSLPFVGQANNAPQWNGTKRVNILLLGIDQRPDEKANHVPARSDVMIVFTIDPSTKTAGMLSVPRDIWTQIPGHGENKINTANFFGDADKYGSGPLLAKKTVQNLLGVPIQYYVRVDFEGFQKLIDLVGGVTVDVETPLKDDEYPTENYGIQRIYIPVGIQHMDGQTALHYARSRHADNDIWRNQRQQQVLLAARQQALRMDLLPRLPAMLGTILQSVQTDIPPAGLLGLARLGSEVKSPAVVNRAIDLSMVDDVNGDGTVLVLNKQKAAKVIDEVFSGKVAEQENATIEVLNGTERSGLAASVASILEKAGYTVVNTGNASGYYNATEVLDYNGKATTTAAIVNLLKISPKAARSVATSSKNDADIQIILGQDFKAP